MLASSVLILVGILCTSDVAGTYSFDLPVRALYLKLFPPKQLRDSLSMRYVCNPHRRSPLVVHMRTNNNEPSEDDKAKGKKLADAWIRQDKALECAKVLQGKTVFLLGSNTIGKKAIGQLLAKRLGTYRFLDTCEIIAAAMSKPECVNTVDLITVMGEEEFRKVEEAVMEQMQQMARCVVAIADEGTLARPMNWIRMQQGITAYITREGEEEASEEAASVAQVRVKTRGDQPVDDQVLQVIQALLDHGKRSQQQPS